MAQDDLEDGLDSNATEAPPCYSEGGASAVVPEGDDKAQTDAKHAEVELEPTQRSASLEPTQVDTPSDHI